MYKLGSSEFQNVFLDGTFKDISIKKPKVDTKQVLTQICSLVKGLDESELCTLMTQLKMTHDTHDTTSLEDESGLCTSMAQLKMTHDTSLLDQC